MHRKRACLWTRFRHSPFLFQIICSLACCSCTSLIAKIVKDAHLVEHRVRKRTLVSPANDWLHCCRHYSYSRFLVRHHWFTVSAVVVIAVALTILGFVFTRLPDFSDPRKVGGESQAEMSILASTCLGMGSARQGHDLLSAHGVTARLGTISAGVRTAVGNL